MDLRDLLGDIGRQYDRTLDFSSPAQQLLKSAGTEIAPLIPSGYRIQGSGGRGNTAVVPWIAIFDPDETATARQGMYLVYLFDAEMYTVALSLNQGVTDVVERFGVADGRVRLEEQASAIRQGFEADAISGLDALIDLRSNAPLPRHYECGNIVARTYKLDDLPGNDVLVHELNRFVRLYDAALQARADLHRSGDPAIISYRPHRFRPQRDAEFKPKSSAGYRQVIQACELVKGRRHEALVSDFGNFLLDRGFHVATNVHPRDLVAENDGDHWLIEAKMVRGGDAVAATREALAQLLMYRKFLYEPGAAVHMLALFSEDVGAACVDLLSDFRILSAWPEGKTWHNFGQMTRLD